MAGWQQRDRGKERFWRRMVAQCRRSGLSVRAFCAEHNLAEPLFYAWRRTIAQRDRERESARVSAGHSDRKLATDAAADDAPVFVPLRVIDASAQTALEVVLERGHVVRVLRGFDAATPRHS